MGVSSIGVDIIETERIRLAIARWGEAFLFRIFTPAEVAYCRAKKQSHYSFAARFAVKEAVIKAIGTGLTSNLRWTSIEIVNDRKGKAEVRLGERVKEIIGKKKILISMSHTHQYAIGEAMLLDEEEK
jgi:holo-[acyl-carrier protein] synthase